MLRIIRAENFLPLRVSLAIAIRIALLGVCRGSKAVGAEDILPAVMLRIIRAENFLPLPISALPDLII